MHNGYATHRVSSASVVAVCLESCGVKLLIAQASQPFSADAMHESKLLTLVCALLLLKALPHHQRLAPPPLL
jgi:hypothetical protein